MKQQAVKDAGGHNSTPMPGQTSEPIHTKGKNQKWIDGLCIDKLDRIITTERYEYSSAEWRIELSKIGKSTDHLNSANRDYSDYGVKLQERAQHTENICKNQNDQEKRKVLKSVYSNSFWKDGELMVNCPKAM